MTIQKSITTLCVLVVAFVFPFQTVWAAKPEINIGFFNKLAIHGYDPVAYFTQGQPVEGDKSITLEYKEAKWLFASEENRDLFQTNPEKYTPQYGGHCAYAASRGYIADADPIAWRIVDDKLYLNYDLRVKRTWESNLEANIDAGDRNWPGLLER